MGESESDQSEPGGPPMSGGGDSLSGGADRAVTRGRFPLSGLNTSGSGRIAAGGFVVDAGARARAAELPSLKEGPRRVRRGMVRDGVLRRDGGSLVLTTDHRFSTPGQAAAVLLGRSANGWAEWKDSEGRPLSEATRGTQVRLHDPAARACGPRCPRAQPVTVARPTIDALSFHRASRTLSSCASSDGVSQTTWFFFMRA